MKRYRNNYYNGDITDVCNVRTAWAKPVNKTEAEKAVKGWLKADAKPMNMALGGQVKKIETYNGADGQPAYHIVYLKPSGFVIVAADDAVEPIIGFVNSDTYDPSPENPS